MPPFTRSFALALALTLPALAHADPTAGEFFEKKIRPILVDNCYSCHSANGKVKGGLRVDSRANLLKGGDSGPAIVPKDPAKSHLIEVIRYDGDVKMPPRKKLSDAEIADLTEWVKLGAPWPGSDNEKVVGGMIEFDLQARAKHWSFQPMKMPPTPTVSNPQWVRSPIDAFILQKLDANQLKPTAPAEKRAWLRRVTLDLIGLPPTIEETDAFLKDESDQAHARVVDRLLQSPHYGERWARHWLDLVRFAETAGHEFDFEMPEAWRYRDYLIRAFNADLPYNQFVIEHLAGDLVANPRTHPTERTNESILGTGFWFLGESKHSPVDIRQDEAERIDNQIDVFSKTFLGLTLSCARCHDHKFDAISTRDYYSMAGFLQSSRYQRAFIDDPAPIRDALSAVDVVRQRGQAAVQREAIEKVRTLISTPEGAMKAWDAVRMAFPGDVKPIREWEARAQLIAEFRGADYGNWFRTGEAFGTGPTTAGQFRFGELKLLPVGVADSGRTAGRAMGALRSPTFRLDTDFIHYRMAGHNAQINLIIDGFQQIRYPIYGGLTIGVNHDDLRWHTQDVRMWKGHMAYIEILDDSDRFISVDRIIASNEGAPAHSLPVLEALATLRGAKDPAIALKDRVQTALDAWEKNDFARLPEAEVDVLFLNTLFPLAGLSDAGWKTVRAEHDPLAAKVPHSRRAMAMCDGSPENERVFIRGSHKNLGVETPRRGLEAFHGNQPIAGSETSSGRLALAQQLVQADHPLTARVLVNRVWHHHFGRGIVPTPDDFGVQGTAPSHPELLDYLAQTFVRDGWSMKKLHREIVLSNTYRMASTLDPASEERDPPNKWWHRMSVRRLEAEAIRDSLLAISGRLDRRMEGPGTMPHLTPFMVGRGRPGGSGPLDGDGRRSIYLNVRRNFLNPMFLAFDYPIPFSTMGRRSVSNVPAQALAMMNNPFVAQQAERWGKRIQALPNLTPEQRIERMYAEAFTRPPTDQERAEAMAFITAQGQEYGSANDPRAWADMAHVLVNLKEFIFIP